MFIESLDPRRLMAVTGLDPTFGSGGIVKVALPDTPATLSVDGAVFVETRGDDGTSTIVKYRSDGRVERGWGNLGRATVSFDVTHLAFDRQTAALYAAGTIEDFGGARVSLGVVRIPSPWGMPNVFYGENGVATYTPDAVSGRTARAVPLKLIALNNGRLLVAMERTVSDDQGVNATNRVTGDISLMQFKSGGQRNAAFGTRGIVPLLGTVARGNSVDGYRGEHTTFHDLAIDADGTYKAVLTRKSGRIGPSLEAKDYNPGDTTAAVSVKLRTISTAGVIDADKAYSWTVADGSTSVAGADGFTTPLIGYAGGDRAVSIAQTFTDGPIRSYSRPLGYTFVPGRRPTAVALPVVNSVLATRNNDGYFFVGTSTSVTRLRPDFTLDRRFAVNGTATSDPTDPLDALTPDADGGVLARVGFSRLVRFA